MAQVLFYAPMKPPTHAVPSGDREMARGLMAAIGARGDRVELVSELRVYDGSGARAVQRDLIARAGDEAARLIRAHSGGDARLWVSYHNYYKAPDLVGPAVCAALNLPYVQIESTRAKSRLNGAWADFATRAEAASDAADLIFYLTEHDFLALNRDRPEHQRLVHLRPFLPVATLPDPGDCAAPDAPMLAVGMMRTGDKLASYRIIADTLARLGGTDWRLDIAGDGPARPEVEALMARFGSRVRFLGQLDRAALADAYRDAALLFWPGVNEAFGMVYLEAQATALPVVAQDRPGMREVLGTPAGPPPEAGARALADEITRLLGAPDLRRRCGDRARARIARDHLMGSATGTFWAAVAPLLEARA